MSDFRDSTPVAIPSADTAGLAKQGSPTPARRGLAALAGVIACGVLLAEPAAAQLFGEIDQGYNNYGSGGGGMLVMLRAGAGLGVSQAITTLVASAIAFVIGFVGMFLLKKFPRAIAIILLGLAIATTLIPGVGLFMTPVIVFAAFLAGIFAALARFRAKGGRITTFGSAEWATAKDVAQAGLTQPEGFFLGAFASGPKGRTDELHYAGDRHLLTVAPTRAGKGVSAIIPNLLTYEGSALVIDPKGENALITGEARRSLGQSVMLLDPWDLASSRMGIAPARFNPLDWLRADDPDLAENAMLLADALVMPSKGENRFWDEEAKGLIFGLLLYLATDEREAETKNLGRLRDLLTLAPEPSDDPDEFTMANLLARMFLSDHPLVASSANRYVQKADRERASVMSSAQSQTHFLDSPRIRESLSASDFDFAELKSSALSVYLILPADRLNTFGRWLRLLIQQAITVNARNIETRPDKPVLFMLDEMPALGHLSMVEQAYGLMAGFGIQLWGIVQDLSQLKRIYGESWETFIGNSGVLQYFGSRDQMTAEYFSKLCGVTTIQSLSESIARAVGMSGGDSTTTTTSVAQAQRSLAYPDELMRLADDRQLLLVQNHNPIAAIKQPWFEHPILKSKGRDIRKPGPVESTAPAESKAAA